MFRKAILCSSMLVASITLNAENHGKIKTAENPVQVASVSQIGGFIGDRIQLNRDGYLKHFPIDEYVDFVVKRQHHDWIWTKAEQHGKWIESTYLTAIQGGDTALLAKAQNVLYRIIDSQEPSGYLGATALDYRSESRPVRGMDAYELYFVFHAFMTVYEETGDQKALTAAEKLADYYLRYFGPGKLEFWPSKELRAPENKHQVLTGQSDFAGHSVHYGWEGTLLCEPIARLYQITGKKKYLDWSKWVVSNIDRWSGWDAFSRLDSVADGTLGVDKLQPYVHSHTFHMNFMGFLRLYQITGDKSYLRKVEGAWNDIFRRQMYITGGVSVAEHYEGDYIKPLSGNIVETCATMSWMQLTQQLLYFTGNPKYADAIERLMLNHVFAAQDALTGICRYHTAPNGEKPFGYYHGPDCCTASGHRIISMLPTFFYAQDKNTFYINQYVPNTYTGTEMAFTIEGNYPETEKFEIRITKAKTKNKELKLRIPAWCHQPSVSVNGVKANNVVPGQYLTLSGKWKEGDVISVSFPMELKWVQREHHTDNPSYRLPGGEIMYKQEEASRIPFALTRGPLVYCVDMVWNKQVCNDDINLSSDLILNTDNLPTLCEKPYNALMGPVYQAQGTNLGRKVNLVLTPFCNIGWWWRPEEEKPADWSRAFTYAIWMFNK